MKPIIHNQANCIKYAQKRGTVNVTITGRISFNNRAIDILQIKGQKLNFVQDAENVTDWYIELTDSKDGFEVITSKNNGVFFYSKALAVKILSSINSGTSCKFILSPKKAFSKYFAIITHSKITNEKKEK